MGIFKVGPFDITAEIARDLLQAPSNSSGRSNRDVIHPFVNALDITQRPRGKWIIDFRDMDLAEAGCYEAPFDDVARVVKPERDTNRRPRRKAYWWQHGETEKRTLTNLYNARPNWLDEAHWQLDAAVLDAYGWPHDLDEEGILARLLALNLERAAGQGAAVVVDADEA
jgi:hypothetical protein